MSPVGAPNVLSTMTDKERFDTIDELEDRHISSLAMDLLVARGLTYTRDGGGLRGFEVGAPERFRIRQLNNSHEYFGCNRPVAMANG